MVRPAPGAHALVVFLMIYAGVVWLVIYQLRRRWLGLLAAAVSPLPALGLTHLLIATYGREGDLNWLPVVVWPFVGVVTAVGLVVAIASRSHHAFGCHGCGYDLAGNESGVCPECGRRIDSPGRIPAAPAPRFEREPRVPSRWAERYVESARGAEGVER